MKLLFLDIDGVLDSETFHHGPKDKQGFPFDRLDIKCLRRIEKIVANTGCQVVISSTWRETWGISDFNDLFKKFNCNIEIYALNPVHRESYKNRGSEIYEYIKNNESILNKKWYEFNDYVILDDDCDMLYYQRNNFIFVDRTVGLTDKDCKQAIMILNNPPHPNMGYDIYSGSRIYNSNIA